MPINIITYTQPVVDEWIGILGQVLKRQWNCLNLKQNDFNIEVSHDVDRPGFYCLNNINTFLKNVLKSLARKEYPQAIHGVYSKLFSHSIHHQDPYNTFDWLMSQNELYNRKKHILFFNL